MILGVSAYAWAVRSMQASAVLLPPVLCMVNAPFGKFGIPTSWNVNGALQCSLQQAMWAG